MNPRVLDVVERANRLCLEMRVARLEASKVETWNCFLCGNDSPRGGDCLFCTPCACFDCDAIGKLEEQCCGDMICADCVKNRDADAGERAEQQLFEDYHGGVAPDYVYEAMASRGGQ